MRARSLRRGVLYRYGRILALILATWSTIEFLFVRAALGRTADDSLRPYGKERIFIASIHWNTAAILREHWVDAVVDLAKDIGRANVHVSVQESGSWDDSKAALRDLDAKLQVAGIPRSIFLDDTTHLDAISRVPSVPTQGWIPTPHDKMELRRIPYLAQLRNIALQPMYELLAEVNMKFDKILFLNDVVFQRGDVRRLFATRDGEYAAACSLDFSKPPSFYDTFALRDSEGHEALMQAWPFFRASESRQALKANRAVPVSSCWNGMVFMDAAPFYEKTSPLAFRGIADSLAVSHLEGSECCLIHADNPLSHSKGVWLNPSVRVAYNTRAYEVVNPSRGGPWVGFISTVYGSWKNRLLRWTTTAWFKEKSISRQLTQWTSQSPANQEPGSVCLINEMQVLVEDGWVHV